MKYMLMLQTMLMGPMSKPDEPMMRMSLGAWRACWTGDMSGGEDEIHVDVADDKIAQSPPPPPPPRTATVYERATIKGGVILRLCAYVI